MDSKDTLSYQENAIQSSDQQQEKKKRKRNIIWYNPPYLINVKINTYKVFFKLHKHFPKTNTFYKIFHKSTVKSICSSMRKMASIISFHNRTILRPNNQIHGCNCRRKVDCLMQNKCLTTNIIYEDSHQ